MTMSNFASFSVVRLLKLLVFLPMFAIGAPSAASAAETIKAENRYLYVQPGQTLHNLSLIHISEPTRLLRRSRMPSSA